MYIDGVAKYPEDVDITMNTNYHSTFKACEILFPIRNKSTRVVNISSREQNMHSIDAQNQVLENFGTQAELMNLLE